jgi:hypothetical protein
MRPTRKLSVIAALTSFSPKITAIHCGIPAQQFLARLTLPNEETLQIRNERDCDSTPSYGNH